MADDTGGSIDEIERRVLDLLRRRGPMTMEEIIETLRWEGDRRSLRRVVAEMVRKGLLSKKPDYERRKILFYATSS